MSRDWVSRVAYAWVVLTVLCELPFAYTVYSFWANPGSVFGDAYVGAMMGMVFTPFVTGLIVLLACLLAVPVIHLIETVCRRLAARSPARRRDL
jgi:hypothetical protein